MRRGPSPSLWGGWAAGACPPAFSVPPRAASHPPCPGTAIRGMPPMTPAPGASLPRLPRTVVDGGYYTKTRENRFLACPLPVEGAWVLGALSGYGLMAAARAAGLLADHITGRPLPRYAPAFSLERYDDPAYRALLAS